MTNALPYKTKQIFFLLTKWGIVIGSFYFVYYKLSNNQNITFYNFILIGQQYAIFSTKNIGILVLLSFLNWYFEIKKWQVLVGHIYPISFYTALKQTLGALTASLFSPNRIIDYVAKSVQFKKQLWKQIILLNAINNSLQMVVTVLFGSFGLSFLVYYFGITSKWLTIIILLTVIYTLLILSALAFTKSKFTIKGFSIQKLVEYLKNISFSIKSSVFLYAFIRYFAFSFQFYSLLLLFKIDITYTHAMAGITTMYLLASSIPSIAIFDVVLKGSIALFIFNYFNISEVVITYIMLTMWLLNTVLPSIIGSYFVLTFNPKVNSSKI